MKSLAAFLTIIALSGLPALAEEAPPAKALRYHEALLKRPANATLYDRFLGAWLDEQSIESLDTFLADRAAASGGPDTAILARHHLRRGRENEALDALQIAITTLPDDPSLPFERAKILMRRLEFAAARQDLARVSSGTDATLAIEAAKLTGRSHLREGNTEQAIQTWDTLLASNPGDEDLLEDLVESAATEGEMQQAIVYAEKLIAATNDPYRKTLRLIRRGDLLAQAGSTDEAIAAYTSTLADVGESSWLEREILAQISQVFRKQDRIGDLKDELAKLAAAHPGRFLIHRELATLEVAQGEVDAAVGRFREILQRSPGNRELREEFIRLLADGGKFDDAAAELEKIIELSPEDSGLHLQMAELRHQQGEAPLALAALNQAHKLLGNDEPGGLRIASLMLQYGATTEAEALLVKLTESAGATTIPAETLAAEYARTSRRPRAIDILEKIAATAELDTILRVTGSISAMGELEKTLAILNTRAADFPTEPAFLTAIARAAMAANQPAEAIPHAITRLRLASHAGDLGESINLATRAITAADQIPQWRESLANQENRTLPETCLLAALAESQADFDEVNRLLTPLEAPLALRFHATLLDLRGEFENAITTLLRLADTEEGRKATFFKELSDLQTRAGNHDDALATIERWKQSAPGDKSAWITGGELLRQIGRPDDAVRTIRQAVGRFEGDADLTARLANLHEEAGQFDDAAALFWRLYDDAASPSEQARWAVQLAKIAVTTGQTDELEEKFRERAAGNRRSIGPILAQVELARARNDDDKRRDLLMDALRLQPTDVDLRLQIAQLEEQSGNLDRVIAILQEAVDTDPSNRIRAALAQACLRNGDTTRALRELRILTSQKSDDVRSIENSAATLAGAGLYEEAIRFLRESLPDGGDWRANYLLAIMLAHDGREAEALPLILALLHAEGDIPGLAPASAHPALSYLDDQLSSDAKNIFTLFTAAQRAFSHANARNNHGMGWFSHGNTTTGPFSLPDSPQDVRQFAIIHLAKLARKSTADADQIQASIRSTGIHNLDFVTDLLAMLDANEHDFANLLKKHPKEPGLVEITLAFSGFFGGMQEASPAVTPEHLDNDSLSPRIRMFGWMQLAQAAPPDSPVWSSLIATVRECLESDVESNRMQAYQILIYMLSDTPGMDESLKIPEKHKATLKSLLRESALRITDAEDPYFIRLNILAIAGTRDEWIKRLNQDIQIIRTDPASPQHKMARNPAMRGHHIQYQMMMRHGQSPFTLPSFDTLTLSSIPSQMLVGMITGASDQMRFSSPTGVPAKEIIPLLDQLESNALRAWIAIRAGDEEAITAALAATPDADEVADFAQLSAIIAIQREEFANAFSLMEQARPAYSTNRQLNNSLNTGLLAIAAKIPAAEREPLAEKLRPLLIQCRSSFGIHAAPAVAQLAAELGFDDLASRFAPTTSPQNTARLGPASFGSSQTSRPSAPGSLDQMKKFITEKKPDAAAREALVLYRQFSTGHSNYELGELRKAIDAPTIAQLITLTDPGDSKSLTRRLEYADICAQFGKPEHAVAVLRKLIDERPDDGAVAGRLAFLLPAEERDFACQLLTKGTSSPDFVARTIDYGQRLSQDENNPITFDFIETITRWLESEDPANLASANLSWIAYYGKEFVSGSLTENQPNLLRNPSRDNQSENKDHQAFIALAKRLATAMHRHPAVTEAGFRILSASNAWKFTPVELDELARHSLLTQTTESGNNPNRHGTFTLIRMNGSSSSGDDLGQHASITWLTTRMGDLDDLSTVFPADYLTKLEASKPDVASLIASLRDLKDLDGVRKLWDSGILTGTNNAVTSSLRKSLLDRIANIPGTSTFFLEKVREIPPASLTPSLMHRGDSAIQSLLPAALSAAAKADAETRTDICSAIANAIYGPDIDWNTLTLTQDHYMQAHFMNNMFDEVSTDLVGRIALLNTFYRLGIPTGSHGSSSLSSILQVEFADIPALETFVQSLGLLDGVDTWAPLASHSIEASRSGASHNFFRSTTLLQNEISQRVRFTGSRSALIDHFSQRQPQTFGSLITAASYANSDQRAKLTAQAFALDPAAFDKLPQSRIEEFALLLPWLFKDAIPNLPEVFRKKQDAAEKDRLLQLTKDADDFLKNANPTSHPFHQSRPFNNIEELVAQLAAIDMEKAVAVFLEAERRFTASLGSPNTQLSTYTSDGLQVTQRDGNLADILRSSSNPLGANPELMLEFHQRIATSPEGGRFAFTSTANAGPTLYIIGNRILQTRDNPPDGKPSWLRGVRHAAEMPDHLRKDAHAAIATYLIGDTSASRSINANDRALLAKTSDLTPEILATCTLVIGTIAWNDDDAPARQSTKEALLAFANDDSIEASTRYQLAVIILQKSPSMAADPEIAAALTTLFEQYATAGRSVVNALSLRTMRLAANPTGGADTAPFFQRINTTFWKNADSPVPGGHPEIPPSAGDYLFLAAAFAGDDSTANRLLASARPSIQESPAIVARLIAREQFDLAKRILPPRDINYRRLNNNTPVPYDRHFEDRLATFRESHNIPPLDMLRLEAQFKGDAPFPTGPGQPAESETDREIRLANAYRANPPKEKNLRIEILSQLTRDSHTAAILLRQEILALRDELDLAEALDHWHRGEGSRKEFNTQFALAQSAAVIFRQAAFLDLLDGNPASLIHIADVAAAEPANPSDRHRSGIRNYLAEYIDRICQSAPIWICEAVANGKTEAFTPAFDAFAKLAITCDSRREFTSSSILDLFAIAEFLAYWNDEGQRFDDLLGKIDRQKAYIGNLMKNRRSPLHFATLGSKHLTWTQPSFHPTRRAFLLTAFTRQQLHAYFGHQQIWVSQTAKFDLDADFLEIAAAPPEDTLPTVLPHLLNHLATHEFNADRPDAAFPIALKAIAAFPTEGPWKDVRFRVQMTHAERMLNLNKPEQANQIATGIDRDALNKDQTERLDTLTTKIQSTLTNK